MTLRIHLPSTSKVLKRIIGPNLIKEILVAEPDWRLHFGMAASRLNISEASLMKAIAEMLKLNWDSLNDGQQLAIGINCSGVDKTTSTSTWEEVEHLVDNRPPPTPAIPPQILRSFLQIGAFPLYNGSDLCGAICIDPARLGSLLKFRSRRLLKLTSYGRLLAYSAPFLERINSEVVSINQESAILQKATNQEIPSKKVHQALQLIYTEAQVFKSDCRIIPQDESRLVYQFLTPEGDLAEGTISSDIGSEFIRLLDKCLSNESYLALSKERFAIVSKDKEALTLRFSDQIPNVAGVRTPEVHNSNSVLILEDDAIFSKVTGLLLRDNGYCHEISSDPFEAICKLRSLRSPPLAILCDIQLSKGNGLEFIHAIRNDPHLRNLNVIALTSTEDPLPPLRAGADLFIRKSDGPELLLAYLSRLRARTHLLS